MITSPTRKLLDDGCHLDLGCSKRKQSEDHFLQNWLRRDCTSLQRDLKVNDSSLEHPSGNVSGCDPARKCPADRNSTLSVSDEAGRSLEYSSILLLFENQQDTFKESFELTYAIHMSKLLPD